MITPEHARNADHPPSPRTGQTTPENHAGKTLQPRDEWILVGRVSKTVGFQGMVRITSHSDNPDRFAPGARLFRRQPSGEYLPIILGSVRENSSPGPLDATFEGISTLDEARILVGAELFIPGTERVSPPIDAFYPDELVGMAVQSPDGETIGKVISLESETPSPYLSIESTAHGEVFVPFRKVFIRSINRKERVVQLNESLELHIPGRADNP